jgi:hypothetical protein
VETDSQRSTELVVGVKSVVVFLLLLVLVLVADDDDGINCSALNRKRISE